MANRSTVHFSRVRGTNHCLFGPYRVVEVRRMGILEKIAEIEREIQRTQKNKGTAVAVL